MRRNKLHVFFIILTVNFFSLFSEELSEWSFFKTINITGNNKYKYFFLDKDVYQYADRYLSDLRIVNENNSFVPFFINEEYLEEKEEIIGYESKQIYKSRNVKENYSIYDFQLLTKKGQFEINKMALTASNNNYSKQIEIYGRNDNTNWELLSKDTIYDIENYLKDEVVLSRISSNNFYRIKVLDNKENLEITKCVLYYYKSIKETELYSKKIDLKFEIENKENYSVINIKNPFNLKLINFNINTEGNFDRSYDLHDGTSDSILRSGNIYNFKSNNINISNTEINMHYEYLPKDEYNLIILNKDNNPLKIKNISGNFLIDKIIFEDNGSKSYSLYYGNMTAKKPEYDIEIYKDYINKEIQDACSLGTANQIKAPQKESKGINYKIFLNIIIIFASSTLVIILILKLTKKH